MSRNNAVYFGMIAALIYMWRDCAVVLKRRLPRPTVGTGFAE